MTLLDYLATVAEVWLVLAAVAAAVLCVAASRLKRTPRREPTNWIAVLPPVPPSRRESALLADQPAEVLAGTALTARFEHVARWSA